MNRLDLPSLDGANPLGFLAALGTLAVLSESEPTIKLGWKRGPRWTPFLESDGHLDQDTVKSKLVNAIRGQTVSPGAEEKRKSAQKNYDNAKKALKDASEELKKSKLRGNERKQKWEAEVKPKKQALDQAHSKWLAALKDAVPSPELALGQRPDCTVPEFREHAERILLDAKVGSRTAADLFAAFGAETSNHPDERIQTTPFCFITGSGHQWFLDTARELMGAASDTKVGEALFEPWAYRDEKFSMRWDPQDDRRYALIDRDPTASDNKSTTVWMANLLAYRALVFFPCARDGRALATTAWSSDASEPCFTWPIWESPLTANTIRSLLQSPAFGQKDLHGFRAELRARSVTAIFRCLRIEVGNNTNKKINFSPATAV